MSNDAAANAGAKPAKRGKKRHATPAKLVALDNEDPFEAISIQDTIEYSFYSKVRPVHPVRTNELVQFLDLSDRVHAIDLSRSLIKVKIKLVKTANKADLGANAKTGIINLITSTLWDRVSTYFNETLVSDNNLYWLSSYLRVLLNVPEERREEQWKSAGWEADEHGKFHSSYLTGGNENSGFVTRAAKLAGSTSATFMGPVLSDGFRISKLLPPGVDIRLNMHPNTSKFVILSGENDEPLLILEDVALYLKKVKLTPDSQTRMLTRIRRQPAIYNMERSAIRTHILPAHTTTFNIDHFLVQEKLPHTITIGIADTNSLAGDYTLNPLSFAKYKLNALRLIVNGVRIPALGDEDEELFDFLSLYEGETGPFEAAPIGIEPYETAAGYYLMRFNLSPRSATYISQERSGKISIQGNFETGLTESKTLVAWLQYHETLTIDHNFEVKTSS